MPDFISYYKNNKYPSAQQQLSIGQVSGTPITVVLNVPSQVNSGVSFYFSGTLSAAGTGTITIQKLNGTAWTTVTTAVAGSSWTSLTMTPITTGTTFRAFYSGDATYQQNYSSSKTVKCWGIKTNQQKIFSCYSSRSHYVVNSNTYSSLVRTDSGNDLYQGYTSSTYAKQVSQIYFDNASSIINGYLNVEGGGGSTSTIIGYFNSLSSVTITKVELYLNCKSWAVSSGGTAYVFPSIYLALVGATNMDFAFYSGVPAISASWSTVSGSKWIDVSSFNYMGPSLGKWDYTLNGNVINFWAMFNGFDLARNNTSNIYYGRFTGNGDSAEPQLRFTYSYYTYV